MRFSILDFRFPIVAVVMLAAGSVQAETVTTVASSNVTAWSAQLHASYDGLVTGRLYSGTIYYGLSDAGTNALSWTGASSSFDLEPTTTNDLAGVFARTVVGLVPTNTYYFRASLFDFDTFATTWATQSLTLTTRNQSPTSMPGVAYAAVTVGTNGVLHSPVDFFEKNGILPTSGVDQILIRITSNETWIALFGTGKLDRANAIIQGNLKLQARGDAASVSEAIEFRSYNIGDNSYQTNFLVWAHSYGGLRSGTNATLPENIYWHTNNDGLDSGLDAGLFGGFAPWHYLNATNITNRLAWGYFPVGGGTITGSITVVGDVIITNASGGNASLEVSSALPGFIRLKGGIVAPLIQSAISGRTNLVISTPNHTAQSIKTGSITLKAGDNEHGLGLGGDITLEAGDANCFDCGSIQSSGRILLRTQHTDVWISSNKVEAVNGVFTGNAGSLTNIPVSGLRISNTYTGGVMRLVTTDGVNFFLQ